MLPKKERRYLLALADESIREGITSGHPLAVDLQTLSARLAGPGATFVTLKSAGRLRGCIGSLEASRSVAEDCAGNAFAAAFRDPRFPPLNARELPLLEIHVSLLAPPEPLPVNSEADLLDQLRPGLDGVVLQEGRRRATFLPSVWEQLPNPKEFVRHLKRKAGLPDDYWSPSLQFERYTVEELNP